MRMLVYASTYTREDPFTACMEKDQLARPSSWTGTSIRYLQPADGDVFLIAEAEADDVEHLEP